jgi:hypothetical protein
MKPATRTDLKPAMLPIEAGHWRQSSAGHRDVFDLGLGQAPFDAPLFLHPDRPRASLAGS